MNAVPNLSPTTFEAFFSLGFTRLVPIVPHTAQISPKSSLANRPKSLGKAVGIKGADGLWHGIDWIPYESDARDCARWAAIGAGVGIKTGRKLIGIDADAYDQGDAATILSHVMRHFGVLPARVGRFPKTLYVCALTEPMPYTRIDFGPRNEKGQLRDRVEILSDGRQFVAAGVHPETKAPYTWTIPLVRREQLPVFSPAQIIAFLEDLSQVLPAAQPRVTEGAASNVNQASLRGDIALVRKAVAATPNSSKSFGTREQWLGFGYAIKAALPDNQAEAFEIYSEWSERWVDEKGESVSPGNTPEYVAAEWSRCKPPFKRGASYLYELAESHNPAEFKKTDVYFDVIPEPDEPARGGQDQSPYALEPSPYAFPDAASIPRREWLYGDHYIRGFVSASVAPGGLGKSSLTIAEALAMVSGKPLLGVKSRGQFRVWLWNGEDPRDELDRRISAAMQHHGLTPDDVGDRLLVDSGMEQEIVLARETRNGAVIVEPVAGALISAIERKQIDVFVADPFVSSHKVGENDNGAIDLVVKRWAKIAFTTRSSIELVHHVRKTNGEEVTVEDARGASALVNGTRVTRALTRMTAKEGQSLGVAEPWRYFRSGGVAKNNLAPSAGSPADKAEWFTLKSEMLGNGQGHGVEALMTGDAVGVVTRAALTTMATPHDLGGIEKAFKLIRSGNWRADPRAGDAWVGHAVAQAFGLDASDSGDKATIQGMLKQWRRELRIRDEAGKDASRHIRQFVRVNPSIDAAADAGVFA
jgi:hypothetical protein